MIHPNWQAYARWRATYLKENQPMKPSEILKAAKAKIAIPATWTQGVLARDKNGDWVDPSSEAAVCFCSWGAIAAVTASSYSDEISEAMEHLRTSAPSWNVAGFNDLYTHEDVMKMWDKAIAKAEKAESDAIIAANLEALIARVEAQPEGEFDLCWYKKPVEGCGTLFCTIGLAATMPEFQAKGYELHLRTFTSSYSNYSQFVVAKNGEEVTGNHNTDAEFGNDSFNRLFNTAGEGDWDSSYSELGDDRHWNEVSDKDLALWRLRKQLSIYKGEVQ